MAKLPVTVITGFLGAGKTTMLRHLIASANGRKLAFIINEFGDLGVDGEVIRACGDPNCDEDDIFELANGCICCTVADDFVPTMERILDRPDPPDHVIIETSGLALPKPLIKAFNWPAVRTRATVDGVIAVIDGDALAAGRFATDEEALSQQRLADDNLDHESPLEELFEEQLGAADVVVLNKTDLLDPAQSARLHAELMPELRPGVKIIEAVEGRIDADVLLGLSAAAEADLDTRPSHHDGLDDADHEHDDFESFVVEFDAVTSPEELGARLLPVIRAHDILRIKGFVGVVGRDMRLIVQAVGDRVQHYFDRDWLGTEDRRSRLVVIGQQGLNQTAIREALAGGPRAA
jgi:cobalamin biosynthesis protein CobW